MSPAALQTASQIAVLVGVLLTGLGSFGAYYYGKVFDAQKDAAAASRENRMGADIGKLLSGNEALQKQLAPFEQLASRLHPSLKQDEALEKLRIDLESLKKRAGELEEVQRPRSITPQQRALFFETTKGGPFGPVILATRTAMPNKEQEDFTMSLRKLLNEAGFGNKEFDIVNGFSTGIDPKTFLLVVSSGSEPPPYFANLAAGLFKLGLLSPDVPVAVNNKSAKPGLLYVYIPEK